MKTPMRWLTKRFLLDDFTKKRQQSTLPTTPDLNDWPGLPLVSVIVAAWNEGELLEKFLKSLDQINYPNLELILVAGGDEENYQPLSEIFNHQLTLIEQCPGDGKFKSIRKGFAKAQGDLVFLTDADCMLNTTSFRRLIYPLVTGAEDAVTGPTQPLNDQLDNPFVQAHAACLFRKMHLVPGKYVPFLIGANCALRHSLLDRCLRVAEYQPIGEDYYLALTILKSGGRILYDQNATIETRFAGTFRAYVHQQSRWFRSHLILHYQFHDRRWIGDVLKSVGYLLLLATPLLLVMSGLAGALVWLMVWGVFFIPCLKAKILAEQLQQYPSVSLVAMLKYMLADFSARAMCLPQLILRRWRQQW